VTFDFKPPAWSQGVEGEHCIVKYITVQCSAVQCTVHYSAQYCTVLQHNTTLNPNYLFMYRLLFSRLLLPVLNLYSDQSYVHLCTVLCSTAVQCSTIQYSAVQYSTVQYSTVQYSLSCVELWRVKCALCLWVCLCV